MSGRPMQPHPLPPVRRDYEGSRLETQRIISAYECVIPVIRRLLKAHQGSLPVRSPQGASDGGRKAFGGAHQ
jgi:hypothetical protein